MQVREALVSELMGKWPQVGIEVLAEALSSGAMTSGDPWFASSLSSRPREELSAMLRGQEVVWDGRRRQFAPKQ
jgi:hypothetical protein